MAGDHDADQVDSATVSIADGAGVVESGTATLTVSVDAAVDVPVTVSWSVVRNPDLGAGEVAAAGSAVFPASGATVREALVTLADDSVNEGTETLEVSLTGLTAEGVGDRVALDAPAASGTANVIDDDGLAIGLDGAGAARRGNVATYTVEFAGGVSAGEEVTVTLEHMGVDADGADDGVAAVPGPAGDYEVLDPATGMPLGPPAPM